MILIAALLLGIAVDALRVRWDLQNDRFIPIVRASEIERITLSALADAGVRGIGLRASEIARGAGMSAAEVVRAGLVPVLIVDQAVSPRSWIGLRFRTSGSRERSEQGIR